MTNIEIIDAIKAAAIAKWGEERWETDLTREWNNRYNPAGDTVEAYRNRRSQVARIFASGNPGIKTVAEFATCVGLTIKL